VVVLDGAGWHTSGKLDVPQGLRLLLLPSHTPELQPAERLWPLLHEPVVNRPFADVATLQTVLVARCAYLTTQQAAAKALTNYH
jgi:transposase